MEEFDSPSGIKWYLGATLEELSKGINILLIIVIELFVIVDEEAEEEEK